MSDLLDSRNGKSQFKLAVLIDAENVSSSIVQGLFDEIAKLGTASIRKIYGDWTTPIASSWKPTLHKYAIQPVQQFSYSSGKNSSDSALIIEAMDIMHEGRVNGFCIVSSDSDFTRLATRIRESGLIVYGFGMEKTPEAFRQACDQFIFIENLRTTNKIQIKTAQKESETPALSTTPPEKISKKNIDDDLLILIQNSVDDATDETGWAFLGDVGSIIRNKAPDFDQRTYGYKKLNDLIKAINLYEIEERKTTSPHIKLIYLKLKEN